MPSTTGVLPSRYVISNGAHNRSARSTQNGSSWYRIRMASVHHRSRSSASPYSGPLLGSCRISNGLMPFALSRIFRHSASAFLPRPAREMRLLRTSGPGLGSASPTSNRGRFRRASRLGVSASPAGVLLSGVRTSATEVVARVRVAFLGTTSIGSPGRFEPERIRDPLPAGLRLRCRSICLDSLTAARPRLAFFFFGFDRPLLLVARAFDPRRMLLSPDDRCFLMVVHWTTRASAE